MLRVQIGFRHLVGGAVSDDGAGNVATSVPDGIQHGSVNMCLGNARLRQPGGVFTRPELEAFLRL